MGTAVGGDDVGVGAGVGVSGAEADSQANTSSIVDRAAIVTVTMLLEIIFGIGSFERFIGLFPDGLHQAVISLSVASAAARASSMWSFSTHPI